MDDEEVYGGIIDELSFKAALEQDPPIISGKAVKNEIVPLEAYKIYLKRKLKMFRHQHDALQGQEHGTADLG